MPLTRQALAGEKSGQPRFCDSRRHDPVPRSGDSAVSRLLTRRTFARCSPAFDAHLGILDAKRSRP